MNYKEQYEVYFNLFENYLKEAFDSLNIDAPNVIKDAMKYAVLDGGKRIRPVLCLAAADMLGVSFDTVKEFAVALECVHSYSLVHDDLPAMDNDDYRRGKFSTHKKFGEANGILAGDALLNFAFEYCLSRKDFNSLDAKALKILGEFAGYSGMIAGQVLDLQYENEAPNVDVLYNIYKNKTAKLIIAPLLISSQLSGGKYFDELYEYGYNLGVLFQIIDDIMDVECSLEDIGKTPNKDSASGKLTSISIFGLNGAKELAKKHYDTCMDIIKKIPNSEFLQALTDAMFIRRK